MATVRAVVEHQVDDARDRVGPVLRRAALAQYLDPLDGGDGDGPPDIGARPAGRPDHDDLTLRLLLGRPPGTASVVAVAGVPGVDAPPLVCALADPVIAADRAAVHNSAA